MIFSLEKNLNLEKYLLSLSIKNQEFYYLLKRIIGNFLLLNQRQRHFFHIVTPSP
jgi:hypothetical protein